MGTAALREVSVEAPGGSRSRRAMVGRQRRWKVPRRLAMLNPIVEEFC